MRYRRHNGRYRHPTSAEQPYSLDSVAPLATILNDVVALRIWRAFLNSHRLFAYKAAQKINQRAFIVVQMMS
jgi:hypothetical protein